MQQSYDRHILAFSQLRKTGFSYWGLIFAIFRKLHQMELSHFRFCVEYLHTILSVKLLLATTS